MLSLYNSLTRSVQPLKPLEKGKIGMYTCGPTVYHYVHVGNLRTYLLSDTLRRALKYAGFQVNAVMNITDVGHLTDDADEGEDKMEKGARREGKTAWEIAAFYTEAFHHDLKALNILEPSTWAKATDHIQEQMDQVQQLIDKGLTYETSDGIYMDTSKLDGYGALAALEKQDLQAGARVDMGEKKNPHDFALWKFSPKDGQRQMEWEAFGRMGFPGWHIECSSMAMKYLGDQFDIHVGGIDLRPVHHVNEIAQAESVTGKRPWVNFWIHGEHLTLDGERMSKSDGNITTLEDMIAQGLDPLAYRYFVLQAHYRKQLSFTKQALDASAQGLKRLRRAIAALPESGVGDTATRAAFADAINHDLNTAGALAVLHTAIKEGKIDQMMVAEFDKVLGLNLTSQEHPPEISADVQAILDERAAARAAKNYEKSDLLRDQLANMGYEVEDTPDGQVIQTS